MWPPFLFFWLRYVATASLMFARRFFSEGVDLKKLECAPVVQVDRHDGLQARWTREAFGVRYLPDAPGPGHPWVARYGVERIGLGYGADHAGEDASGGRAPCGNGLVPSGRWSGCFGSIHVLARRYLSN